jgi:DNA-binding NtrC family response regulator
MGVFNTEERILIVDDDPDVLRAGKLLLKRHYAHVVTCDSPELIPALMRDTLFDAVLLDMNFAPGQSSGEQGFVWLDNILALDPDAVVVMITAHADMNLAVTAIKRGATDFIAKPWQNEKVVATLSAGVKLRRSRGEAQALKKTNRELVQATTPSSQSMLGNSDKLKQVLSLIERAAPTDANVLILGGNGTGKELVARELHRQSLRSQAVFMSVDLGAITESLFESELFGYKKGAFTGATQNRVGRLAAANGGTLFLDEIGNLPLAQQAKLLTVLEQRQVAPVGSYQTVDLDIRVIAATNLPPAKLRDGQLFRQDLLFRLNTVEINLPDLKDRAEDIPLLAHYYVSHYSRKYDREEKKLSPEAIQALQHYHWPGNIRALRHAVERAVILSEGERLQPEDFQLAIASTEHVLDKQPSDQAMFATENENLNLEQVESKIIHLALKKHRYNISHSAKELGLTRAALYRRMKKHGL